MAGIGHDDRFNANVFRIIRHHNLGHQNSAGSRHEAGRQQIINLDPHCGISGQDGACHACHACCHHQKQLRRRQPCQIRADHQRAFALANEDIGSGAQAFNLGNASDLLDAPANPAHNQLHDAQIIKHGNERREEDDDSQPRQSKAVSANLWLVQITKNKPHALLRIAKQAGHTARHGGNRGFALRHVKRQNRNDDLQGKSCTHHAQTNVAAV